MQISGNAFLVTGGSSGLGAACARRLTTAGARVAIGDLNAAGGRALANELGASTLFCDLDVTQADSVIATLDAIDQGLGPLRGVIHCAGILGAERILGKSGPHDLALFSRVIQVNLVGTFNVLRLAAARMAELEPLADGERGVILNTSSVAAYDGQIGQAAYAAAKGGVASLMLPAARELARFGIRVLAIAPGIFATAMVAGMPDSVRAALEAQAVFPKRLGAPAEFAALAQHIIENVMLNGSIIRLDGGVRLPPK